MLIGLTTVSSVLFGCNGWSHNRYYEIFENNNLSDNISRPSWENIERDFDKQYCVYSLSYFFPLNFWNLRFSDKQYVVKAAQETNINKLTMIKINDEGFGSPIFSYFCVTINGIFENENRKPTI